MSTLSNPLTYTPFPTEALPGVLAEFVRQGAHAIGCDEASLALPALCAAAGVLGNSRRLQIKSTWMAPPILWGCILGESGTSKSPAMRLALAPLREYQRRTAPPLGALHILPERGAAPPKPPRRVVVSDATVEALAQVARENPLGLLLARDELAGFFGSLDRYGGQGAEEAFFLSAYDGESVEVDRKTAIEHVFVPAMALSIIGTCQPAVFAKLMTDQRRASGLLARFLLVEPPAPPKVWGGADVDPQVIESWAKAIESLLSLGFLSRSFPRAVKGRAPSRSGTRESSSLKSYDSSYPNPKIARAGAESPFLFEVSPPAAQLYQTFYDAHNGAAAKEAGDRRAFYSKAEQLPLRLALVLHHLQLVTKSTAELCTLERVSSGAQDSAPGDDMQISGETMQSALTLTHWFTQETLRVYTLLSLQPEERLAYELEEWIRARGGKTTLAQIARAAPEKFREPKHLAESLLRMLEQKSRGSWNRPQTIAPLCPYDLFDERTWRQPEVPVKPREFWLKGVKRAG